jgi:hypothetical protein
MTVGVKNNKYVFMKKKQIAMGPFKENIFIKKLMGCVPFERTHSEI